MRVLWVGAYTARPLSVLRIGLVNELELSPKSPLEVDLVFGWGMGKDGYESAEAIFAGSLTEAGEIGDQRLHVAIVSKGAVNPQLVAVDTNCALGAEAREIRVLDKIAEFDFHSLSHGYG